MGAGNAVVAGHAAFRYSWRHCCIERPRTVGAADPMYQRRASPRPEQGKWGHERGATSCGHSKITSRWLNATVPPRLSRSAAMSPRPLTSWTSRYSHRMPRQPSPA